jgi:hypothetical protein
VQTSLGFPETQEFGVPGMQVAAGVRHVLVSRHGSVPATEQVACGKTQRLLPALQEPAVGAQRAPEVVQSSGDVQ